MKQSRAEVQKRQNQILEMFHGNDALQVSDVSQILRVSEITIRRDFDYLEKKGYITRFHGGATLNTSREGISPYTEGSPLLHSREKQMIALAVSSLLEDNQTVFMNAGTTILEIFKAVRSKHMRIVSNSALAGSVIGGSSIEFICTGGIYQEKTCSFTGDFSTPLLSRIYADACVLGVDGLSSRDGITTRTYSDTMLNDLMVKRCKGLKIIAADGSKIGRTFSFTSFPLSAVDILVTDSSADRDELSRIRDLGIRVILADEQESPQLVLGTM